MIIFVWILQLSFFKDFQHPDEDQRSGLSEQLGLDPNQIKAQNERANNSDLRAENERISCENESLRKALKEIVCQACGGPSFGEEERLEELLRENLRLRKECKRVCCLLSGYIGKPISEIDFLVSLTAPPLNLFFVEGMGNPCPNLDLMLGISENVSFPNQFTGVTDMERAFMTGTVAMARDELIKLLRVNEPLWVISPTSGKCVIHRDYYEKLFPRAARFKSSSLIESSKDSALVCMSAIQLVEMFLDMDRWSDLFPRLVTKAKTIQVLETGMPGSRDGALLLMFAEMHILSPMVAPRKFFFLRSCQQIEAGLWAVVDVSHNFLKSISCSWKLPSGCIIQDMPNEGSKVTWIEHVEADDKSQTHRLFRDLVYGRTAYGSDLWVTSLQRMCERLAFSAGKTSHHDFGVVPTLEGKRSLMNLSQRMVKSFCSNLSSTGEMGLPPLPNGNNSGVRFSVRSTSPGEPYGTVLSVATSLWLPHPRETIFSFLLDNQKRPQWDVLCHNNPVSKMLHISTSNLPGNYISIIRPFSFRESLLVLQESCTDALGSCLIFAPYILDISEATAGWDSSDIPILPSGFIVSEDGRTKTGGDGASSSSDDAQSGGSLLTVVYNILVSTLRTDAVTLQDLGSADTLISTTVQKIKAGLGCSASD